MKSAVQMKLNPSPNPTKSDFITQVISSIEDGFIPYDRTDLVEKERQVFRLVFLFLEATPGFGNRRWRVCSPNSKFFSFANACIFAPQKVRRFNHFIILQKEKATRCVTFLFGGDTRI